MGKHKMRILHRPFWVIMGMTFRFDSAPAVRLRFNSSPCISYPVPIPSYVGDSGQSIASAPGVLVSTQSVTVPVPSAGPCARNRRLETLPSHVESFISLAPKQNRERRDQTRDCISHNEFPWVATSIAAISPLVIPLNTSPGQFFGIFWG